MSNQPNKFIKRTARPQTIAGAMGGLLKLFTVRASDADLAQRWSEIMGRDIGALTSLAAIKKSRNNKYVLAIRPNNPAFALQLSYQSDEIIKRVNKYFGYDAVEKITFRK